MFRFHHLQEIERDGFHKHTIHAAVNFGALGDALIPDYDENG